MRYAALVLLFALPAVGAAQTPEPETPTIVVTGSSTQTTPPDMVTVAFAVTRVKGSPGGAVDETTRLAEDVVTALGGLGVSDLEIERIGFAVTPNWEQKRDGERKFKGYEARTTIRARTQTLAEVGRLVKAGTDAGATIGGISFASSEVPALRRLALGEAAAAARQDAVAMAEAAGGSLGRLVLLTTDRLDPEPGMRAVGLAAITVSGSPMIDPQNIAVSARVRGRWEFVPSGN